MCDIRKKTLGAIATFALMGAVLTAEAKTYVYKHMDGTVWHTDITPSKVDKQAYKLIGVINAPRPKTKKKKSRSSAKKKSPVIACGSKADGSLTERAAQYMPLINSLAKQYSISKHLIMAVVATESCFDTKAVSSAGARGLMQLMPITARELGVKNPFDHEENLRGGVQYLGKLSKRFNYNPKLTLAAYNAGPGNVVKYKGIPPFPETKAYVEKVMSKFLHYMENAAS